MNPKVESPAVEVSTTIHASPETIFQFFQEPKKFSEWIGAPVEMSPGQGNAYRIAFGDCKTIVAGKIVEVVPNKRIAMSWGVEAGDQKEIIPVGSTKVIITLEPVKAGTKVTLRHEGLPNEKERRDHEGGWYHYLSQLSRVSIEAGFREGIDRIADDFFAAWGETDPAKRQNLLESCWAEDGEFMDRYGTVNGRDALNGYIGTVQQMMPGAVLRRSGEIRISHNNAYFAWEGEDAQGNKIGTGLDFSVLAPDGRFLRMVGFWN